MRKCVLMAVGLAVRMCCGGVTEVNALPSWEFVDTEVSTNRPLKISDAQLLRMSFSVELAATPSNNVQIAFGCDVNTNGVLEVEEQGLVLGWDCGAWTMRRGLGAAGGLDARCGVRQVSPVTEMTAKRFSGEVRIGSRGICQTDFCENGRPLDFGLDDEPPDWLFDRSWNMLRATVRGVDTFNGKFRACVWAVGTAVIIR